jgi:tetratricopeptide (TPR) repeat protein
MPAPRQTSLQTALQHHTAGELQQAERIYQQLLIENPNHADALHLLGMLRFAGGKNSEAETLIRRAIAVQPEQAVFHSNLGIILAARGNLEAAIAEYQRADALAPASPENLNNLGVALHATGKVEQAIGCFKRAVILNPNYRDARSNLMALWHLPPESAGAFHAIGDLLHEADRSGEAISFYRKALDLHPESAETCSNLGNALFAVGEYAEALFCYQQAIDLCPHFAQAHNNLANALKEFDRLDEAIVAYQKAVQLQPGAPEPLNNLGNALREKGQWEAAMQCYEQAMLLDPKNAVTLNNRANAYCERGQWQLAIDEYEKALLLKPDYADAINNLGTALEELGERDRAMECYQRARELTPRAVSPPWNIALLQLLRGDYENGWRGYENRWRQKKQCKTWRDFPQPMLKSIEQLKGARVLLHAEQGFGDAMQFCRYATLAAEQGATVLLECPAKLARLFRSIAGVSEVIERGRALPAFDVHCPLMSLPMIFSTRLADLPAQFRMKKTVPGAVLFPQPGIGRMNMETPARETVPGTVFSPARFFSSATVFSQSTGVASSPDGSQRTKTVPGTVFSPGFSGGAFAYLFAEEGLGAEWRRRVAGEPGDLRVGLVWAGQATHQKDRDRSLSLNDFAALGEQPRVRFYSLQVGPAGVQASSPPAGMNLVDWTGELDDFADTAAVVCQLDLVISVDTAVCHLAGAMGKPVWVLLPYQPDWRWLLDREDSPWYPTARLFRQPRPGDWEEPLRRVAERLARVAASK